MCAYVADVLGRRCCVPRCEVGGFQAKLFQNTRFEVQRRFKLEHPELTPKDANKQAVEHWMQCETRRNMLSGLSESELKRRRFLK